MKDIYGNEMIPNTNTCPSSIAGNTFGDKKNLRDEFAIHCPAFEFEGLTVGDCERLTNMSSNVHGAKELAS